MKNIPDLVLDKENYMGKVKSIRRYYMTIKGDTEKKETLSLYLMRFVKKTLEYKI